MFISEFNGYFKEILLLCLVSVQILIRNEKKKEENKIEKKKT